MLVSQKSEFRPKIWFLPFLKSLVIYSVFFVFFSLGGYLYLSFLPFIVRYIFKIIFFDLSKTQLAQKKWLWVRRTTLSHTKVSLELFSSTYFCQKIQLGISLGNKNHIFFLKHKIKYVLFNFFVCVGWNCIFLDIFCVSWLEVYFFAFSRHLGLNSFVLLILTTIKLLKVITIVRGDLHKKKR